MLDVSLRAITFLATLGAGLMAGLFFAFSVSVMGALGRLPPEQGSAAMRTINVVILNPLFGAAFFGTAILSAILLIAALARWGQAGSAYLLAGALLYLIGIIAVTIAFNVPLNNLLAGVKPESAEGAAAWTRYLAEWVPWNHVRTVAGLAALGCFVLAFRDMRP